MARPVLDVRGPGGQASGRVARAGRGVVRAGDERRGFGVAGGAGPGDEVREVLADAIGRVGVGGEGDGEAGGAGALEEWHRRVDLVALADAVAVELERGAVDLRAGEDGV